MPVRTRVHVFDLPNLSENGIEEIRQVGSIKPDEIAKIKIEAFKSHLKLGGSLQPSFFISNESWKKLFNGLDDNGNKWIDDSREEVYGFIFCIAFEEIHGGYQAYFRIRTILKNNIKVQVPDTNLFLENPFPYWIEQNHIAYVDVQLAFDAGENDIDCVKFIDSTSAKFITLNASVTDFKRNVSQYFERPYPITNIDEVKLLPERLQQVGKYRKTQQGTIFSSKCTFLHNLKNPKVLGSRISFAWDNDSQSYSYIIHINPYGEINGIKCPVPETACNYTET